MPEDIFTYFISFLSLLIAASSYTSNRKNEAIIAATKNTTDITKLQERVITLQNLLNMGGLADVSMMKQSIDDLKERFSKLDNDVEKKVDQINDKIDKLLLHIIKNKNDV